MKEKFLDCLYLLRQAHIVIGLLGWESDLQDQVKDVFGVYREKYNNEKITRRDVKSLESYLLCINTFDKKKVFKKNNKVLS